MIERYQAVIYVKHASQLFESVERKVKRMNGTVKARLSPNDQAIRIVSDNASMLESFLDWIDDIHDDEITIVFE